MNHGSALDSHSTQNDFTPPPGSEANSLTHTGEEKVEVNSENTVLLTLALHMAGSG